MFLISFGMYLTPKLSMLYYHHLHTELSNGFLLICTHEDLLYMSYPLFGMRALLQLLSYFFSKHH